MSRYLIAYAITAVTFLVIDFLWLSIVAKGMYAEQLGHLLRERPNLAVASLFYLVFAAGIVVFAVNPALTADSALTAVLNGALLGLLAYATYDVTNYSTLKDWPLGLSIIDTLWGTALTGFAAWVGFLGTRAISAG